MTEALDMRSERMTGGKSPQSKEMSTWTRYDRNGIS